MIAIRPTVHLLHETLVEEAAQGKADAIRGASRPVGDLCHAGAEECANCVHSGIVEGHADVAVREVSIRRVASVGAAKGFALVVAGNGCLSIADAAIEYGAVVYFHFVISLSPPERRKVPAAWLRKPFKCALQDR